MKLSSWVVAGVVMASVGLAACETVLAQPAAPPAPGAAPQAATPDAATAHAKATYEDLCTGCHEAGVIESQGHTRAEWDETVHGMVDRGLTATPAQLDEVISYLAKNFPPQASPK